MGYERKVSLRDDTCFMPASFAWRLTVASRRFIPKAPVRLRKRTAKAPSSQLLAHSRSSNEAKKNID